ncbi:hypothetical protein BDN72DRAFT_574119 [Pluteus cervinus]|uniref:Uncharacterized protein n=1 Tax=Pluteus cervinus TaxID=181527 RepID=A0ACD3A1T8_9AGAR|nr:hypothetical protein BDN72DRAFT_574119 [Pluteus cervinus]
MPRKRAARPVRPINDAPPLRMHPIFAIPELLDMIFSYLDHGHNASNALVCKRWSQVALDTLWRDVQVLPRLFSILAPMHEVHGSYRFVAPPTPGQWQRFERYSSRVRMMAYMDTFNPPHSRHALHPTVFDTIARTRTALNIFPNMHTLYWGAPAEHFVLFLHPGVRRLILRTHTDINLWLPLDRIVGDIVVRSPGITTLDIRTGYWDPETEVKEEDIRAHSVLKPEANLCRLISQLSSLRQLVLPQFWFTSAIAETAAKLPDLHVVEFQHHPEQGLGNPLDTLVFNPPLAVSQTTETSSDDMDDGSVSTSQPGPFPALVDISLPTRFTAATAFMHSWGSNAQNLTHIHVNSQILESSQSFQHLIQSLASASPMLTHLVLISLVTAPVLYETHTLQCPPPLSTSGGASRLSRNTHHAQNGARVTYSMIRPLTELEMLKSLELSHHRPVSLSKRELVAFAEGIGKWGIIEKLDLFGEPWWGRVDEEEESQRRSEPITQASEDEDTGEDEEDGDNPDELILPLRFTLHTFARYCPSLQHLFVFVHDDSVAQETDMDTDRLTPTDFLLDVDLPPASNPPSPAKPTSDANVSSHPRPRVSNTTIPLPNLKTLCFGPSPIANPPLVALFLSRYIPSTTEIRTGVTYGGDEVHEDWPDSLVKHWNLGMAGKLQRILSRLEKKGVTAPLTNTGASTIDPLIWGVGNGGEGDEGDEVLQPMSIYDDQGRDSPGGGDDDDDDEDEDEDLAVSGVKLLNKALQFLFMHSHSHPPAATGTVASIPAPPAMPTTPTAPLGAGPSVPQSTPSTPTAANPPMQLVTLPAPPLDATTLDPFPINNLPPASVIASVLQTFLPTDESQFIFGIHGYIDQELLYVVSERAVGWSKVSELVPLLCKMREEEVRRARKQVEAEFEMELEMERAQEEQERKEQRLKEEETSNDEVDIVADEGIDDGSGGARQPTTAGTPAPFRFTTGDRFGSVEITSTSYKTPLRGRTSGIVRIKMEEGQAELRRSGTPGRRTPMSGSRLRPGSSTPRTTGRWRQRERGSTSGAQSIEESRGGCIIA